MARSPASTRETSNPRAEVVQAAYRAAAEYVVAPYAELVTGGRLPTAVRARHIAWRALREELRWSQVEIGLGAGYDSSTVATGVRGVTDGAAVAHVRTEIRKWLGR